MCPSSIYRYFRMGNHRLKCVKHPFYSHFRAAQGAFPSVQWLNQPNRIYPHPQGCAEGGFFRIEYSKPDNREQGGGWMRLRCGRNNPTSTKRTLLAITCRNNVIPRQNRRRKRGVSPRFTSATNPANGALRSAPADKPQTVLRQLDSHHFEIFMV